MVVCLEQGAVLHMAQLMPLPLTVSCFSKIQIGVTFLVPAHLGSPGKRAVKRVCVCVRACVCVSVLVLNNSPRHPAVHSRWPCSAHKPLSVNQCQAASADVLSALQPRQHLQSRTEQAAAVLTAKGHNAANTYWTTFARARFLYIYFTIGREMPTLKKLPILLGIRGPTVPWTTSQTASQLVQPF